MRQVTKRKPSSPRTKSGRRGASPARVPERESFGKRSKFRNDPVTRFFRTLKQLRLLLR